MATKKHVSIAGVLLALAAVLFFPKAKDVQDSVPTAPSNDRTATATDVGFASKQGWLDHYEKHGREFGSITKDQYLALARALRDAPIGGTVVEAVRADGVISRFDARTGAFLAFNRDRTIRTFFKPNDGARYFERQIEREHE